MEKRNVRVNNIKGTSVAYSSILSIGDAGQAKPKSRLIAVQKEGAIFSNQDNVEYKNYPIFNRPANWPAKANHVKQQIHHHVPLINVHHAAFTDLNTSSIFQVGSIRNIAAEARIKHFRILRNEDVKPAQSE